MVAYYSGESGGDEKGKKGQDGVRLAIRKCVSRAEALSREFISNRLLEVTLALCGGDRAVTLVVGYALKYTRPVGKKHAFWTAR